MWAEWHGILFEEPNPTGSRPSDLIGLYRQQMKPELKNREATQTGEVNSVLGEKVGFIIAGVKERKEKKKKQEDS